MASTERTVFPTTMPSVPNQFTNQGDNKLNDGYKSEGDFFTSQKDFVMMMMMVMMMKITTMNNLF